jgi:aspartate kinase
MPLRGALLGFDAAKRHTSMPTPDPRDRAPLTRVLKFGGAALADGAGVRRACSILLERGGPQAVAVVSAAHGVTQLLDQVAKAAVAGRSEAERVRIRHRTLLAQCGLEQELLDRYLGELATVLEDVRRSQRITPAQHDFVLSFGERMSARVVAATLRRLGREATPVDSFDLGLLSDSNHGSARPLPGTQASIRKSLASVAGIPVVTGFLAQDPAGNLTTLGRNGSDLTASLLGEALGAAEVQFWKTVGGVMTADPALVPGARRLERLSYDEAAEYAFRGASVLHPDALQPLARAGIPARVLSVVEPDDEGTRIGGPSGGSERGPVGIAWRRNVVRLRLELAAHEERWVRAAAVLAEIARAGLEPLACTVDAAGIAWVLGWSDALAQVARAAPLRVERGLALIAVVGPPRAPLATHRSGPIAGGVGTVGAGIGGVATLCEQMAGEVASSLFLVGEDEFAASARALHAAVFESSELLTQGF